MYKSNERLELRKGSRSEEAKYQKFLTSSMLGVHQDQFLEVTLFISKFLFLV